MAETSITLENATLHIESPNKLVHQQEPPPTRGAAKVMGNLNELLPPSVAAYVEQGSEYMVTALVILLVWLIFRWKPFSRPPPVPKKKLPRRPALSILFKPDDEIAASANGTHDDDPNHHHHHHHHHTAKDHHSIPNHGHFHHRSASSFWRSSFSVGSEPHMPDTTMFGAEKATTATGSPSRTTATSSPETKRHRTVLSSSTAGSIHVEQDTAVHSTPSTPHRQTSASSQKSKKDEKPSSTNKHSFDLPDSFAPLLSSSQTEVLLHHLTADLIHGIHVEARMQMKQGKHEIPLDKNPTRPQLIFDAQKEGCLFSAAAQIGSDCCTDLEDLDVSIPTSQRSRPMVKNAEITIYPAVRLLNVAPTLIHFPSLFEDQSMSAYMRRIPLVRFLVDWVVAISSSIEKLLWVLEGFLQIHLGKIKVSPLYKGKSIEEDYESPEWRLSLAFSGHVLLFGVIPIPFINIVLPSFIIPQPHALLEYLLSKQPLASAKLRRENIAENRIAMAVLDTMDSWNSKVEIVATPPAVGIDLTLPGGVSLGIELMHGRDPLAGRTRDLGGDASFNFEDDGENSVRILPTTSGASMSSWTTNDGTRSDFRTRPINQGSAKLFDANSLVPWKLEVAAKGKFGKDKMTFHLLDCSFRHEDKEAIFPTMSQFHTRGSFAVWKHYPSPMMDTKAMHRAALTSSTDSPSVASILFFPEEMDFLQRDRRTVHYDYAFDISEDSKLDAITFSVGANHPMLNGGSMVTTILESLYAHGSVSAREKAVLDPLERRQKRNILRHLPSIDFTFGIGNSFIPPESHSYTNDGQTKSLPGMQGGRIMVRMLGGIKQDEQFYENDDSSEDIGMSIDSPMKISKEAAVADGIKVVADIGFSSIVLNSETNVKEFPELDIFEGTKLRAFTSGKLGGNIHCHLRPQTLGTTMTTTGPNIFNPLEAYEIDCSGSNLSVRIKESITSLGHRRVIIPTETSFKVRVVKSVIDMALEGQTECELSWDFQGLSPILQVTDVGLFPQSVVHEKKEQVSLLIAPLRQGRLNMQISPVGGIHITKAVTSREDKEGLYDWKFFNALVSHSPDQSSTERLLDVIHDKRSMNKLLQVIKLVSKDGYRFLSYCFTQIWRAKDILDQEGISDPKHIIPGHRMARLFSLLLCDDLSQVDVLLPLIRQVVAGDGLDPVTLKELLRHHFDHYDDWAPEIDRAVRWLETMFTAFTVPPNYVENNVTPLAEQLHYASRFKSIPSAAKLYEQIIDRPQVPLDPQFSKLVSRVSPYLSFHQIEYFLKVRSPKDWQPADLKRIRYVYSIKRKVMDIAESYGGLSFLPQSFLVSVFLGEATRGSLRIVDPKRIGADKPTTKYGVNFSFNPSTLHQLRKRRASLQEPALSSSWTEETFNAAMTPAGRVASQTNLQGLEVRRSTKSVSNGNASPRESSHYELGDCLLGPADVAILLQAGLTSVMKGSSVVQLNQRMLLDLIASQPNSFAVAVLAEIGSPGGQGSPRQLASALMALLEFDQNSFRPMHRLDMHALLQSWLKLSVPRREDYMAGGRWARQSYYDAVFSLAKSVLEDAESYMALKFHIQRVRHHTEADPIPQPKEGLNQSTKLREAIELARKNIEAADIAGAKLLDKLIKNARKTKARKEYRAVINMYNEAFEACAHVRDIDKLIFHKEWFASFYQRNYDALMIKSLFDNLMDNVDNVRPWLNALQRGAKYGAPKRNDVELVHQNTASKNLNALECFMPYLSKPEKAPVEKNAEYPFEFWSNDDIFLKPEKYGEQAVVDALIDAIMYDPKDRERLRSDPLVRLLISNPEGKYDFSIVSAMGVITDGREGTELQSTFERIEKQRGVKTIRADTATARSFEYNAQRIIEAIESAKEHKVPYGLLGYSQGCANSLMAETLLYAGTPNQQEQIVESDGLVCRQLLFSAVNGSVHGPGSDKKVHRLIVMVEEFFKYQQGYFSRSLQSAFLETITSALDSAQFHKMMGGAQSFLYDGCRAFWRESQHLAHVPTCTLRGVLEPHTTPEALEMLSSMLTKQSGSPLHDSQVHAHDAVGHPVYHLNRNGKVLEKCDIGAASIQRTHHWSPLDEEVAFIKTPRDDTISSFDCAKDRHVFPWVDVNARFGFIKYSKEPTTSATTDEES
ncbi:MAG: hypothetical protein SGBAC_002534 [Bacillariaceae sp.]